MKKKIAILVVSSMLVLMGLLFRGCGNSDKFAGDWVSKVGYETDFHDPNYNEMSLQCFHIEKGEDANTYNVEDHIWRWGVDKKAKALPVNKLMATNPKDTHTLNSPEARETFIYSEKDGKLHRKWGNQEIIYEKVSDKDLEAMKERVSQFVDDHMDIMQKIQDARDITYGVKDGKITDEEIKEAVAAKKSLKEEVANYKFKD